MAGRRTSTLDALVVCPPGLEGMVADELAALGVSRTRTEKGGVTCRLTTRQLYAANLFLRCATRVLVRVAGFTVRSFADLERRIGEVEWRDWLGVGVHSRARRWASAIWSGVICAASSSLCRTAKSRSSPESCEAARLNHMWASTKS